MSQENVEIVRAAFKDVAPDIEFENPRDPG
jgi:hypothetical protein